MRTKTAKWTTIATLLVAMAGPMRAAAQGDQEHNRKRTRYILIDMGTLGGPESFLSGPSAQTLNNRGTFVAFANTSTSNPNPNCFIPFNAPDCFVEHPLQRGNDGLNELAVLPGGLNSQTDWIAASGLIAGWSENGLIDPLTALPEGRAVLWTKDGKIIDLGTVPGGTESLATAVNSHGQVVGFSNNEVSDQFSIAGFPTQTRAFVWQHEVMQDLGTLGGPDALAGQVNERGQVAGQAFTNSTPNPNTGIPTMHPFLWIPCDRDRLDSDDRGSDDCKNDPESGTAKSGEMLDLGTLGGTLGFPNSLNNRGQVVGDSNVAGDLTSHPFLWHHGRIKDLGTFGGNNGSSRWINDAGEVVGRADIPGSQAHHAFFWENGVMTDLGTPDGDMCSTAYNINSRGQVVGASVPICGGEGVTHGWIWEKGSPITDLATLVLSGSDVTVTTAFFINDRGEIAGAGKLPNGDRRAIVLIPCDGDHDRDERERQGCLEDPASTTGLTQETPEPLAQTPANVTGGNSESTPLDARPSGRPTAPYPLHGRRAWPRN